MNKRQTGSRYEETAAAFLTSKGYHMLERNFRYRQGEIDLICRHDRYLVFTGVKYRSGLSMESPAEAVDARKQERVRRAATFYLYNHGMGADVPCRSDIVGILDSDIELIQDAFWIQGGNGVVDISWSYKSKSHVFDIKDSTDIPYPSFKVLDDTELAVNSFSTRMGGTSRGKSSTMNLSYSRGDVAEDVPKNFTRMAATLGVGRDRMVVSHQTHMVNLRWVTQEDAGKGVVRERDYRDIDGLIIDVPGLTLVTFYADCAPLCLLGPVNRAIGLSHSGWRGTVKRMGQMTVDAMKEAFGTEPEDLIACAGPSICRECFEVGGEVVEELRKAFEPEYWEELYCQGKRPGKYQLDLWKTNEIIFREAGVRQENIHITNICTMCNSDYLFSHRKVGEERGNLTAFLCLR